MELDPVRRYLSLLVDEHQTNLAEVSRGMGRNHAYLQQFMKRGTPRVLPEDVREALAQRFGVDADSFRPQRRPVSPPSGTVANPYVPAVSYPPDGLISPASRGDVKRSSSAREDAGKYNRPDVIDINGIEFALIGVYDIRASAGFGAINHDGEPMYQQAFLVSWLRDVTVSQARDLAVIRVVGDSMTDTLHNGDHVLVDRAIRHVGRDGIYVLRIQGEELMIKRCMRSARTRLLTIKSDNAMFPTEDGVRDEDIQVEGRVIWLGRSVGG